MCQQFVRQRLRAQAPATFPVCIPSRCSAKADNLTVLGYVDSPNTFRRTDPHAVHPLGQASTRRAVAARVALPVPAAGSGVASCQCERRSCQSRAQCTWAGLGGPWSSIIDRPLTQSSGTRPASSGTAWEHLAFSRVEGFGQGWSSRCSPWPRTRGGVRDDLPPDPAVTSLTSQR
jgi:hypothetical protein